MEKGYKGNENNVISLPSDAKTDRFDYYDDDIVFVDNINSISSKSRERTKAYAIMICLKGQLYVDLNGKEEQICKDELLVIPPATIVEKREKSDDFECNVILLTPRIVQAFLRSNMTAWNHAIYVEKVKLVKLRDEDKELCSRYYELLRLGIRYKKNKKYSRDVLSAFLQAGLLALCSILENSDTNNLPLGQQHTESLFHRFLDLLNHSGIERRSVEYYADKLCITPKYLSIICKKNSGKTAKEWIQEYVTENVRFYLKSTDKSIKEISDLLGFPNPSYLGRFVKERFGVSPKVYRDGLKQ